MPIKNAHGSFGKHLPSIFVAISSVFCFAYDFIHMLKKGFIPRFVSNIFALSFFEIVPHIFISQCMDMYDTNNDYLKDTIDFVKYICTISSFPLNLAANGIFNQSETTNDRCIFMYIYTYYCLLF